MSNAGNVSQIGCGRLLPRDESATCDRQRHHAGDHRGRSVASGRVIEWSDAPADWPGFQLGPNPPQEAAMPDPTEKPNLGALADYATHTILNTAHVIPEPPRPPGRPIVAALTAGIVLLIVLLILSVPAILAAVYRWGF